VVYYILLSIVSRAYVIRLSQLRGQQLVCKYWYRQRTSCSLLKLVDWQPTLRMSVQQ